MRDILFHRDFRGYSGGHGKVYDYYCHVQAHPRFRPRVYFTEGSVREENPWTAAGVEPEPAWHPETGDVLFLGGMDWASVPDDRAPEPVINLIQGIRHSDPDGPLHHFLARRAVRICVGAPVADAILATGRVNGPVHVIEAGLRLPNQSSNPPRVAGRIFVGAIKQPRLGSLLAERLWAAGRDVDLCVDAIARDAYLTRLAAAERAVLLPLEREGFYLPGLEAMALGCATIVPDCIGNRAYARPGANSLGPGREIDALIAAVEALDDRSLRERLCREGRATAGRFSLERERQAFHRLLDNLDAEWQV